MTTTVLGRAAILSLAILLVPGIAAAGLLGDTVSVSLTDLDTNTAIISGSAVVVDPGVEFSVTFGDSTWSLDLSDTGFSLLARCTVAVSEDCVHDNGVSLVISDLNFTPPAVLTGLVNASGELSFQPPTVGISPSSVTIAFGSFSTASSAVEEELYLADFQTTLLPSVPLPATLALLAAGLGLASLALKRPRG
jgi:hypothetical protein